MTTRRRATGFTLLEIAVVVVLMGILATFAVLSIGDRSAVDRLDAEAHSTNQLVQLASDEATLKSLQIGMLFTVAGYRFVVVGAHKRWETYDPSGTLRPRPWPGGITGELHVEGRPIALAAEPVPPKTSNQTAPSKPAGATTVAGKSSSQASAQSGTADDNADTPDSREKDPLKPQVMLLSSGEMTAFALDLKSPDLAFYYHLEGDETGHLKLQRLAIKELKPK
jgi:type II secretion system protein H